MKNLVKLKPFCKKIGSGITPRGGDSVYIDSGVALIRSQNVYNGTFTKDGLAFVDNEIAQKMKGVKVEADDILLNITGDSVARCCKVPESILPARVNQHVSIIRADKSKINPNFLMYFLVSPLMQSKMLSMAGSGGTRKALTKEMIESFDIPSIDVERQDRISNILLSYDNLIDNNRKRIQLLEESARLLFREWFVYFRFPEHEKVKIIDGVPGGWKKGNVSTLAKVKSGYAYNSKDWLDEGDPVVKIGNIIGDGTVNLDDCSYIDENVASKTKDFALIDGDLLIAMTGATVGKVGLFSGNTKTAYLNQRVGKFTPKFKGAELVLYCFFMSDIAQNHITNYAGGAAQPNISASQIESIKMIVSTKDVYTQFISFIKPMFEEILKLRKQNQKLAQARDLLLPRLMNGTITV